MRQSILLALFSCLILGTSVNAASVEIKQIQQVNFNIPIEQWWKDINTFLDPKNIDYGSLFKKMLNGTVPNLNDFEKYVKPENLKLFTDVKKFVEIARGILSLNVNSISDLVSANKNVDLNSVFKTVLNNTLPNFNDYQKYLSPGASKILNETRQCIDIAKQILGLNVNSYGELVKAVATLPKDPVSLGMRIAQVAFAKELKAADAEVVKRLTIAVNNIQDPNLKALIKFVAEHPYTERIFGKDVTKEPVTRLVNFLARLA